MDFVEGVATALLPVTFFEVVMNKAFRRLVGEDAEVSVDTGLRAAEKLQSFLDKHDQRNEAADMRRQVNLILGAVKSTVPQEMWGALVEKIEELHPPTLAFDDETDYDDDVFDPGDCDDMDDAM